MSNATDNKALGSGLTANNEVRKRIFYINHEIIVFFYRWFCDIVYDVELPYPG